MRRRVSFSVVDRWRVWRVSLALGILALVIAALVIVYINDPGPSDIGKKPQLGSSITGSQRPLGVRAVPG